MKWISFFATRARFALIFFAISLTAQADPPNSLRQQHPLAWMHGLPAGEAPGWSKPWWINFEISNGNVWNAPLIMNDKRNGKQYEYMADFEQAHAILEVGHAVTDRLGVSVEIPYAYRAGGFLDDIIDGFHLLLGNRRFNRQYYPKNQDIYSVKTDGVDYYTRDDLADGVANINIKLKFWLAKWMGQKEGSCPCGVSIASQTKLPTQTAKQGGTTGDIDQSLLLNVGVPLFTASGIWFSAGYTFLGDNPAMKDWPRYKEIMMYELNFNFSLSDSWALVMSGRAESPFLKVKDLDYYDVSSDPDIVARNRAASGWNSLVRWRGTNSIGLQYRTQSGNHIQLQMVEDWGVGPYDASDDLYSNNAPDVNFVLQSKWTW